MSAEFHLTYASASLARPGNTVALCFIYAFTRPCQRNCLHTCLISICNNKIPLLIANVALAHCQVNAIFKCKIFLVSLQTSSVNARSGVSISDRYYAVFVFSRNLLYVFFSLHVARNLVNSAV